jgi:tetratricopeptide (TPR) repeat protein
MGEFESALTCYQEALTLRRGTDERFLVADSLALIGDTHAAAGRPAEARESWLAAHEILGELGHPDAGALAAKLS